MTVRFTPLPSQNAIEKIEGLELLINLEYLSLNDNKIKKLENLKSLRKLNALNIANNKIDSLDEMELPQQLQLVSFRGNPVTSVITESSSELSPNRCASSCSLREGVVSPPPPLGIQIATYEYERARVFDCNAALPVLTLTQ